MFPSKPTVGAEMDTCTTVAVSLENPGKLPVTAASWRGIQMGLRRLTLHVWVGRTCLTEAHKCGVRALQHWASLHEARKTRSSWVLWQPAGWTSGCAMYRGLLLSRFHLLWKVLLLHYVKSECPSIRGTGSLRPQRHTKLSSKTIPNSQCIKGLLVYSFGQLLLNSWQLNLRVYLLSGSSSTRLSKGQFYSLYHCWWELRSINLY